MSKRDDPQLRVRIPEELKHELEERARVNIRTLTAEITYRLKKTVDQDELLGKTNGFEDIASEVIVLRQLLEKLKRKYKRQYQAEWLSNNQNELNEAIDRLRELLNQDVE